MPINSKFSETESNLSGLIFFTSLSGPLSLLTYLKHIFTYIVNLQYIHKFFACLLHGVVHTQAV